MSASIQSIYRTKLLCLLFIAVLLAAGCGPTDPANPAPIDSSGSELLQVVASTSIVADVVAQVGGAHIELTTLIPAGIDPHSFEPTPSDLIAIGRADLIFINGLRLEESLDSILDSPDTNSLTVSVNDGVETIALGLSGHDGNVDPHSWFSIQAVEQWVENIQQALIELDPANRDSYEANTQEYLGELDALGIALDNLIAELPADKRKLVTNHDSLSYFAAEYGFNLVGTIISSFSTMASPTAGELAMLQDQIKAQDVPAIFIGAVVNPDLAEQLATDMDVQVVTLYTGGLSDAEGPASNYLEFMQYNTKMIVEALK